MYISSSVGLHHHRNCFLLFNFSVLTRCETLIVEINCSFISKIYTNFMTDTHSYDLIIPKVGSRLKITSSCVAQVLVLRALNLIL